MVKPPWEICPAQSTIHSTKTSSNEELADFVMNENRSEGRHNSILYVTVSCRIFSTLQYPSILYATAHKPLLMSCRNLCQECICFVTGNQGTIYTISPVLLVWFTLMMKPAIQCPCETRHLQLDCFQVLSNEYWRFWLSLRR